MKLGYLSSSTFTLSSIIIFVIDFNLFPSFLLMEYNSKYLYIVPFILMIASAFYYGSTIDSFTGSAFKVTCLYSARVTLISIILLKMNPSFLEFAFYIITILLLPLLVLILIIKIFNGKYKLKPILVAVIFLSMGVIPNLCMRLELLDYDMR